MAMHEPRWTGGGCLCKRCGYRFPNGQHECHRVYQNGCTGTGAVDDPANPDPLTVECVHLLDAVLLESGEPYTIPIPGG